MERIDAEDPLVMHALQEASVLELMTELTNRAEACLITVATIGDQNALIVGHAVKGRPLYLGYLHAHLKDQIYQSLGGK